MFIEASVLGLPITLNVLHSNNRAKFLYERLGFHLTQEDPGRWWLRWQVHWKCAALRVQQAMPNLSTDAHEANEQVCLICERIVQIAQENNPYFVAEWETGYVVLGDFQYWRGYTLFLCKRHCLDLHDLEPAFRMAFLREMSEVAAAVYRAFRPHHLNYELLGNSEPHLHWHLFPRYLEEPAVQQRKPVWCVDKALRYGDAARPSPEELARMKELLRVELGRLP